MSNSLKTIRRLDPQDPQGGKRLVKNVLLIFVNLLFIGAAAWYLKERNDESKHKSARTMYINPSVEKVYQEDTLEKKIYSSDNQATTDTLFKK